MLHMAAFLQEFVGVLGQEFLELELALFSKQAISEQSCCPDDSKSEGQDLVLC